MLLFSLGRFQDETPHKPWNTGKTSRRSCSTSRYASFTKTVEAITELLLYGHIIDGLIPNWRIVATSARKLLIVHRKRASIREPFLEPWKKLPIIAFALLP